MKSRQYYDQNCRKRAHTAKVKRRAKGGSAAKITPAMRDFRELIKAEDDFVRETLQQVVRDQITEAVKDQILGAGEILTGLLPKTLAGLAKDLESKDWMIRSRAQAAVLKYAMEFKDKESSDLDLGKINVIHRVAIPDTPLGRATVGEVIEIEAGEAEDFEKDWPTCAQCGERRHPDAMRTWGRKNLCSSCVLKLNYTRGSDPAAMLERDAEFGGR